MLHVRGCFKACWKTWCRPSPAVVCTATLLPFGDRRKREKVICDEGFDSEHGPETHHPPPPHPHPPGCSLNPRAPMEESLTQPSHSRVQRGRGLMRLTSLCENPNTCRTTLPVSFQAAVSSASPAQGLVWKNECFEKLQASLRNTRFT